MKHTRSHLGQEILVIDDANQRHEYFDRKYRGSSAVLTHVHTVDAACRMLLNKAFDVIYLDHDAGILNLAGEGITFFPCACVIAAHVGSGPYDPEVIIHSANPAGADRMMKLLKDNGVNVKRMTI